MTSANGGTSCEHPISESLIEIVQKLSDGTPVLRATCGVCAQASEPQAMTVQYAVRPVPIGHRWFAMVEERGDLVVCGVCGRVVFPDLHATPIVAYIHDHRGACVGQVDFCRECGLDVIEEDSENFPVSWNSK